MSAEIFKVKVSGKNACFTRPEMKVERVSYDVLTPSAARGIIEAILWKPAIRWVIRQIDLLKPVRWESVRRNEVGVIASKPSRELLAGGSGIMSSIEIEAQRQQRAGLFLREVSYVIHCYFCFTEKRDPTESPAKFSEMFQRRLQKGQCHHQPYLGCREFSAHFELAGPEDCPREEILGDYYNRDLGWMLHDIDFQKEPPHYPAKPVFFRAQLAKGSIEVPPLKSAGVRA